MSKSVALLLVLVFLIASLVVFAKSGFSSADAVEDSWVSKEPMQAARSRLGVAEVKGKIYAIGGDSVNLCGNCIGPSIGNVAATNEEYNPETDTWTFKTSMPTPRCSFAAAVYQNKIYCIGGYLSDRNITGINEVYDPATDTWETKAAMPTPRMDLQANVVNGKIYLIGGRTDFSYYSGVNEVYDPATDTWTTKTSSPNRITSVASAATNGRIYVLATVSSLDSGAFIQIYNTGDDSWSIGASAPTYGGWSATAGVTSGLNAPEKIVFFSEASTHVYYPESDTWEVGTRMPTTRGFAGVAVVNGAFYVIGGIKAPFQGYIVITSSVATNERYTPNDAQPLNADTKIYIRADGSIEPSTANITTADKVVYTFTGNNYERLIVERDNIIVDGKGYTLQGTSSFGITLFQRQNVIIRNVTVREFQTASVGMEESTQIIIFGNNLQANLNDGIRTYASSNNVISGNNITSSKYMSGIHLADNSNNNLISGNNISGNSVSFIIEGSKDNQIYHNNIVESFQHAWVEDGYSNIWDNDKEGNYWNEYAGTDNDGNGIGDIPHIIDENNKDNYPLMATFDVSSVTIELPELPQSPSPPSEENPSTTQHFSTALVAASIASVAVSSVVLLVYFKKRKR
jgi:parallel beta-helix repeat protein